MTLYKWDKARGIVLTDKDNYQVMQLVGATNRFRNMWGKRFVELMNVDNARKEKLEKQGVCL